MKQHMKIHEKRQSNKEEKKRKHESKENRARQRKKRRISDEIESPSEEVLANVPTDLISIVRENWRRIYSHTIYDRRLRLYNFQLISSDENNLNRVLTEIHNRQNNQYKLNIAFGFILRHRITGALRYFHASRNTQVFQATRLVQDTNGLNAASDFLENDMDILEYAQRHRPDSSWFVEMVTNVLVYVYPILSAPIGTANDLPAFIKRNRSIISLVRDDAGRIYDDGLCLFRCLAHHFGAKKRSFQKTTKKLFIRYASIIKYELTETAYKTFPGVALHDLQTVEDLFAVNINVYELREEGVAELKRRSGKRYKTTMYLNLFGDHFSFIQDFDGYTKHFACRNCDAVFKRRFNCIRHEKQCQGSVKFVYPGGVFKPRQSIFAKMRDFGFIAKSEEDHYYPFRATFDIECYFKDVVDKQDTDKMKWIAQHEILSVSVCSNIPGYTAAKCFVSEGNPVKVVSDFVDYLIAMSDSAFEILHEKYFYLYEAINSAILKFNENAESEGKSKRRSPLQNLQDEFYKWLRVLPVVDLNSQSSEINAMKCLLLQN